MGAGNAFVTTVEGAQRITFEWQVTQRRAAAQIIPLVLLALKAAAPVSSTKVDAGRFKHSIGFRMASESSEFNLSFVSTDPAAKYILNPTAGGMTLTPQNTMAMRFQNGFGEYIFAQSVIRGATPGNDFNKRVAKRMESMILEAFKDSVTIIST
jgi:hypothetical protein